MIRESPWLAAGGKTEWVQGACQSHMQGKLQKAGGWDSAQFDEEADDDPAEGEQAQHGSADYQPFFDVFRRKPTMSGASMSPFIPRHLRLGIDPMVVANGGVESFVACA